MPGAVPVHGATSSVVGVAVAVGLAVGLVAGMRCAAAQEGGGAGRDPGSASANTPAGEPDGGNSALIGIIAPPPPTSRVVCPEPPRCAPESDLAQLAWLFAGAAATGMLLLGVWGASQYRRVRVIGVELSRIRIQRTSQIRATRSLAEMPQPPARPASAPPPVAPAGPATGPKVPLAAAAAAAEAACAAPGSVEYAALASSREAGERAREEAEARLAVARAQLEPLLSVATEVEEWFRSREYEATLRAAGDERGVFDRVHRGVAAVAATFRALRDTHVYPRSTSAIDDELERYWEQVYESLDDVYRLVDLLSDEKGRRALAAAPGGDAVRLRIDRLFEAARAYLASDGRRPLPIEPLRTDLDHRVHQPVEARRVAGIPPGKILSVVRCGIVRDGKLLRKPAVIHSL